jgi:collagenase-like PrtC family protease
MNYFSVPSDFKKETIDKYDALHRKYGDSRVLETYGNITVGNFFESGRSVELLPEVDFSGLEEYVNYSRQKNIDFHYTMNASHMQNKEFTRQGILQVMNFLEKLYEIGVRSLTVALPTIMEIVNSMDRDFKIKASVICQVTNANKAIFYKELGARRIVADESIVRDFKTLRKIRKAFGENVEVIVNPVCNRDCTYRMFHYNQISTDSVKVTSDASSNYFVHRCLVRRCKNIGNLLKIAFIRPEDIPYYNDAGIRYFKLQGRDTLHRGDIVRAVEHYFKRSFDGNLMDLIDIFGSNSSFNVHIDNKKLDGFIKPFVEKDGFCNNDCPNCRYCDKFAERAIDSKATAEVYDHAVNFYAAYDGFNRNLKAVMPENVEVEKKEENLDIHFQLD